MNTLDHRSNAHSEDDLLAEAGKSVARVEGFNASDRRLAR
jgi:hypothetical protein